MAGSIPASQGRIYISYRREDTAYPAAWLFDRLANHFGENQVFKDFDSISPGDDFVEVIATAVSSCDVLLVVIGEGWLTTTDAYGRRRLDNPHDFVRLEIEVALARKVRVIPILVDRARMPMAEELPASLARLTRRQALLVSPSRFDADVHRLLGVLERTLAEEALGTGGGRERTDSRRYPAT
jgi:TIR domain